MNLNNPKNILLIATTDAGGAGEYMCSLAKLFIKQGQNVTLLVKEKVKSDSFILQYPLPNKLYKRIFQKLIQKITEYYQPKPNDFDDKYLFYSINEDKVNLKKSVINGLLREKIDFIFTGWTSGFINSTDLLNLKRWYNTKIFTIPIDMNVFTGGCHYAWDCKGYINGCDHSCPAITNPKFKYLAAKNFKIKYSNISTANIQIIDGGSGWTLNQSKQSYIYKNQEKYITINSPIDINVFNAKHRTIAKSIFGFNSKIFYILCGAQNFKDERKGFSHFINSLKILSQLLTKDEINKIAIIVASKSVDVFEDLPFQTHQLDFITDYRLLSLLYQAADVFVNSSIEDSGPMMVSEALACGTPVVGFDMGTVHNLVITGHNGYKAILKDDADLSNGILTIFRLNSEEYKLFSTNAQKEIIQFASPEYINESLKEIIQG